MKKILSMLLVAVSLFSMSVTASANSFFDKYFGGKVVVVTYHRFSENTKEWGNYTISPAELEKDLQYLSANGYEFLKASELKDAQVRGRKIAVLTFDDGYSSDYEYVAPLLEKYNAAGTFFVLGATLDTPGYLTGEQVTELSQKPYVEIGNHSNWLHFVPYEDLKYIYTNPTRKNEIIDDFEENAMILQELTGYKPTSISYPNGLYASYIDYYFKTNGYDVTFSTDEFRFTHVSKCTPVGRNNRERRREVRFM